jgi:hypothetical protein
MDTSASIKLKFIKLNSSLGHAIGFAVSRGGIGAKNINSYLIEQLARASHLPTTRFGKREASGAFNVRPETTEVGRCAEQEDAALNKNLNIAAAEFSEASCASIDTEAQ